MNPISQKQLDDLFRKLGYEPEQLEEDERNPVGREVDRAKKGIEVKRPDARRPR